MTPKQIAVSLLCRTKTGEQIVASQRYRIILSAGASFACNLLYALYHCVLGILNCSLWFITMCAFYGLLATMRFAAVLFDRKNHNAPPADAERFVMRLCGLLLTLLSLILSAISYISLSHNLATRYEEITMITIATYVFYKITLAIVKAVKQRKNPSLLLRAVRNISYAEVAASILTLQRSMLVSFGSMDGRQIHFMNAILGAAVCLFVLALGVSMILQSKERKMQNVEIETCDGQ